MSKHCSAISDIWVCQGVAAACVICRLSLSACRRWLLRWHCKQTEFLRLQTMAVLIASGAESVQFLRSRHICWVIRNWIRSGIGSRMQVPSSVMQIASCFARSNMAPSANSTQSSEARRGAGATLHAGPVPELVCSLPKGKQPAEYFASAAARPKTREL